MFIDNINKYYTKEFFQKFEEKLDTDNCAKLKEKYRNDEIRCSVMIEIAAKVLDEIVARESNKNYFGLKSSNHIEWK